MSIKDEAGERRGVHVAREAWTFLDPILVDCPGCGRCAAVRLVEPEGEEKLYQRMSFGARRMVCGHCATVREQPRGVVSNPGMCLPPRLIAQTRHGELVFFNLEHLDYVRAWLASANRTETHTDTGPRNRSVFSRLPAWAKRAGARDEVIAAIDKARRRAT